MGGRASSDRPTASLFAVKSIGRRHRRWISSALVVVCILICAFCLFSLIRSDSDMSKAHHFVEAGVEYNNEMLRQAEGLILVNDIGLNYLDGICPTNADGVHGAVCLI